MQVAANLSSGAFAENLSVFKLYLTNISNIEAWTKQDMGNRQGVLRARDLDALQRQRSIRLHGE